MRPLGRRPRLAMLRRVARGRLWTPYEDKELRRLAELPRATWRNFGYFHERSWAAVRKRASRLGIRAVFTSAEAWERQKLYENRGAIENAPPRPAPLR